MLPENIKTDFRIILIIITCQCNIVNKIELGSTVVIDCV